MKKLSLYIFLVLMWCNVSSAIPMKGNGQGDLALSEDIIKEFHSYITTRSNNNPLNFFITADHNNVFIEIRKNTTFKGISGSGPIVRNKKKCEQKFKQECFLFANQRVVVWNNGINPIDSKKSKIKRKTSYDELIIKLNELGFIETKEQKIAKEKKLSEEKAEKEKKLVETKKVKVAKKTDSLLEKELKKTKRELEKIKKELEDLKKQKNTPEVKKEEVKKEEVKKEEVKKEEVKKEEVKLDPQGKDVIIIWKWVDGAGTYYESNPTFEIVKQERTIESNLPNCPEPKPVKSMMIRHVYWDNCYGIKLMDQGEDKIFGNDEIVKYEGEFNKTMWNGKGRMTWEDGGIREGVFKDNDLVSSETMPELAEGYSDRFKDCSAVDSFLTKEPDEKSNDLSGYKHIHFGMLKVDFYKILDCKSSLKIFDWDEYYGMGNNRDSSGKQGITIEGLYKYKVGIIFKDDVIDAVRLIMFTTPKIKRQFYQIGETGIEKFEQFKKALSSKYKLQTKPTKISKDEYNNKSTLSILTWVFKNNGNDNLILLKLFQIPAGDQVRYSYSGEIHYLSEEQSKSYTKEIDGTKVKSDDL